MVTGKTTEMLYFHCENTNIPISNELELLGFTVDDKLKYESYISKMCGKVSQQIAVLKRMKKILPLETRKNLYQAFIVPHFKYCTETWHFRGRQSNSKLEKLNKQTLRFVYHDKQTPSEVLVKKSGLSTLMHQRFMKILCTVFRSLKSKYAPVCISELLKLKKTNCSLRSDAILSIPKVKTTTYGLKSWRYTSAKVWNSIPDDLIKLDNYTFCCSLPENIASLTPTLKSLTQKYIHFIQSTFIGVDTQLSASKSFPYRQQTTITTILVYIKDNKISITPEKYLA